MSTPAAALTPDRKPPNGYTDAPTLHPNLVLGSLQLLGWLFFHPTAWRNHVARIDPTLRPDFALIELSRIQWRNPALRRLVLQSCVAWTVLLGLLVAALTWATGYAAEDIAYHVMLASAGCFTLGIIVGPGLVAGGLVGGALAYFVGSLWPGELMWSVGAVGMGTMGGLLINLVGRGQAYSLTRQIGGVLISVVLGLIVSVIVFGLSFLIGQSSSILMPILTTGLMIILGFALVCKWRADNWRYGVALGVVFSVMICVGIYLMSNNPLEDVPDGLVNGALEGAMVALWLGIVFMLVYLLAEQLAGPRAGAIASTACLGGIYLLIRAASMQDLLSWPDSILSGVSFLIGVTLNGWRPILLYPFLAVWNALLYRADERRPATRPSQLRYHSAFWDEAQHLPLPGLAEHLVLVLERNFVEGSAALEYLADSRQRWAAQAAQIELDARNLESCTDVAAISRAHLGLAAGELSGPASALLRSLSRLSQDVEAALRQESVYNQRLALGAAEDRLDGLLRELTRSSERYAARFRPIITHWRQIVVGKVRALTEAVEQRQEIDSPYIIGVPLTAQQEIFVGRTDISARIEELLLDRRRPPLLLYGQRRMGKTSLLINLGRLLPSTIVPFFVDLQGPVTQAADHIGLLYNLGRSIISSAQQQRGLKLPALTHQSLLADPFTCFDEWLDTVEQVLADRTALLALDEFEALDSALAEGRFNEAAVLGMLRHIIQHRPRFKVLLAGSHTLEELQRWASYLINVQVVHLGYLSEVEARHLIERPVQDFALRYEPDASRRVIDLTRGHPTLVQLLCAEIIALKNRQSLALRRLAGCADVEAAVPEAIHRGSFFFVDIERNQVAEAGRAVLRFIATHGEGAVIDRPQLVRQFPIDLTQTLSSLVQRELVESVEGGYRFQVELIRRWFAGPATQNGSGTIAAATSDLADIH